jgi:hypothetical protein
MSCMFVISTNGKAPGPENYQYRSIFFGDDIINMASTDGSTWCINCDAYIMVYAAGTNCSYTIRAVSNQGIITLQDGISVRGLLETGAASYYQIQMTRWDLSDLNVVVTDLSDGDPDIFMVSLFHLVSRLVTF